jgi:methionyl-tRNA synthetase
MLSNTLGIQPGVLLSCIILLLLWTLYWKVRALWKAARRGEKVWFGVLLLVNTIGILEILYLYVFSKDK